MKKHTLYYDLLESCGQAGCPVCRLAGVKALQKLETLLSSEALIDVQVRQELRQSLGFCREHTWLLIDLRSSDAYQVDALGLSILYQDLLGQALKQLEQVQPEAADPTAAEEQSLSQRLRRGLNALGRSASPAAGAFNMQRACPACEVRDSVARLATGVLLDGLREDEMRAALAGSTGLCLPHLEQALAQAKGREAHQMLLKISQAQLEALRAELGEFIRKNDYRFSNEPTGSEGDAWRRVIAKAVGERDYF